MADKEFLERMLSMLPDEFQDIYDDTIPEAKEMRKKKGDKVNTFSRYSYELYLFSDPFNYVLVYLTYLGLGDFVTSNVDAFLAFFIRLFRTIILAMLVILIKNKIQTITKR